MGRFAIAFLPLFVVVGSVLFRRMCSARRRAGCSTSGIRWISAIAAWLLNAFVWSIVIYLAFLTVLFFVPKTDFDALWRAIGT